MRHGARAELAAGGGASALGDDQAAVYANGFLVGDGQIQSKLKAVEQAAWGASPRRLPAAWRTDDANSARR